jgi:hypothetical protein
VSAAVPAAARARDAVALALVVAGAGTYVIAWRGMQALAERRVTAGRGEFLMTQWNSYQSLSRLGLVGMVAGALVAAWSFHRLRKPTAAPPP